MIKKLLQQVEKYIISLSSEEQGKMIEQLLITKYGSKEKAEYEVKKLKFTYPEEKVFFAKLSEELYFPEFKKIISLFESRDNFSSIVDIAASKNSKLLASISKDRLGEIQILTERFNKDNAFLPLNTISDKVKFTIKETRQELGFKNQQTFKKWLIHFFGSKYEGRRKFNLLEYIEVINKFISEPGEEKFDFKKRASAYKERLKNGLVVKKSHLIKFTENDYKLLQVETSLINDEYNFKLPDNVDKYPYSIACLIIQQLE